MIDLERELRATLEGRARLAPPPVETRPAIRVARRRQLGVILTALAVVAAVVAGSVAGVSALIRSSEREVPAGPTPTPIVPSVVSGSALDGYSRTTFPEMGDVHDLAVAPDGTIWGAGRDVVTHFDGETWTTYSSDDGLPLGREGRVLSVEIAPDGTVWTGTEGGLARLDGATWTTVSSSIQVNPIAFAPDGSIVVSEPEPRELHTSRIFRFDGETWSTVGGDQYPGSLVLDLGVAPDGTVWAADFHTWSPGAVSRFDGKAWTDWRFLFDGSAWTTRVEGVEYLPSARSGFVHALTVAPDGTVWATVEGDARTRGVPAVARFDGSDWTFFRVPGAERLRCGFGFRGGLSLGPDGTLWIAPCHLPRGGGSVLFSFDGSTWTRDELDGRIHAIDVAPDGTLWLALDDSLVRYLSGANR